MNSENNGTYLRLKDGVRYQGSSNNEIEKILNFDLYDLEIVSGEAKKSILTKKEKKICMAIKKTLKREKLFFVGIDIINEKLTEINVTSPTGLKTLFDLSGKNLAKTFWKELKV